MNKDNFEGAVRSAVGKGEQYAGEAFKDKSTSAQGVYESAAGKAQQAYGSAKEAVAGAVSTAGDSLSQSAAATQDKLISIEEDVGSRIRNSPWAAVAIAALIGLLIGKMS